MTSAAERDALRAAGVEAGDRIIMIDDKLTQDMDMGDAVKLLRGAKGSKVTLTLAREMQRRNIRWGIASACIGGGQGMALLIENPQAQEGFGESRTQ